MQKGEGEGRVLRVEGVVESTGRDREAHINTELIRKRGSRKQRYIPQQSFKCAAEAAEDRRQWEKPEEKREQEVDKATKRE